MSGPCRKLDAIRFTDIIGYTALMGKDEAKTFNLLEENRQLHVSSVNEYNGNILLRTGNK